MHAKDGSAVNGEKAKCHAMPLSVPLALPCYYIELLEQAREMKRELVHSPLISQGAPESRVYVSVKSTQENKILSSHSAIVQSIKS